MFKVNFINGQSKYMQGEMDKGKHARFFKVDRQLGGAASFYEEVDLLAEGMRYLLFPP